MHVMYPHPRWALMAAVAALALTLLVLMPAALDGASLSIGGAERGAPAATPAPAQAADPAWSENPFAYPLLQVPQK